MSDSPTVLPEVVATAKAPTPPAPVVTTTPNTSFVQRLINVQFSLGTGTFGNTGFDTVTLSALRTSCEITIGGLTSNAAQVRISGMTFQMMAQLMTMGVQPQTGTARRNLITIQAGNASGMATVFQGTIFNAFFDGSQMPETTFYVLANGTFLPQLKPVPPSGYAGNAAVSNIMANLAGQIGATFENNGVTTTLSNPYFPGTAMQQIEACAKAANVGVCLDPASNTLAIWPTNGTRGGSVPIVSADTGMIGYPTLQPSGLIVRTLYNPSIQIFGKIQVQSQLPMANGVWQVTSAVHDLESMQPGGRWQSELVVVTPGTIATWG